MRIRKTPLDPTPDVPLLVKNEVASLLATTPRHVERLVENGRLGHCRVGRFIRFRLSDVLRYLEDGHVAADPQRTDDTRGESR